ncbi:crotonobetainyl-CoA:carnitine CoA-transferase CaiB-like acyl-CoA transferase [Bradyrhizobium sp. LB7.1]
MGPLAGFTILDLTSVLMGPYGTQVLADMGAEIIKVESPEGDIVRQIGPGRTPGMGGMFLNANRGKRSIVLDLKKKEGRDTLLRLAKRANALVYNVRPQAMTRLGLDYETLREINPSLVYVGAFGYGQSGPYAAKPAYDDLIQGAATIPTLLAAAGDGTPRYVPVTIADRIVGLMMVNAIMGGLMHQQRTGIGQRIDVPMFESMTEFVLVDHLGGLNLRSAARPRRLCPPALALSQTLQDQRRLSLRPHLQRQALAQLLRGDRATAFPRSAAFCQPRCAHESY